MAKLMRSKKKFGRCACIGHGCSCEVSREIQSIPNTRAKDSEETRKEINLELSHKNIDLDLGEVL